ncbi:MAG: hypothetical protein GY854_19225 [Deltaproteobacteria bacterium]|nr:hypothetical protein [Deltaproteobacteria bacterium]
MTHKRRFGFFLCALFAVLLVSNTASAKRGFVLFNTGEDMFEAGPLPEPYTSNPQVAGWTAGYKCSIVGVFWIYLHWWDCQPVAIHGDSYDDNPALVSAIAAKYTQSDMKVGFWKGYMRFVLLLIILAGLAFWIKGVVSGEDSEEPEEDQG